MKTEELADLLVAAVDTCRANGEETLAKQLETFAPLVGAFAGYMEQSQLRGRAGFIADLAAHMLGGTVEVALDAGEDMAPKVRRAVDLAAMLLHHAEAAAERPRPPIVPRKA